MGVTQQAQTILASSPSASGGIRLVSPSSLPSNLKVGQAIKGGQIIQQAGGQGLNLQGQAIQTITGADGKQHQIITINKGATGAGQQVTLLKGGSAQTGATASGAAPRIIQLTSGSLT